MGYSSTGVQGRLLPPLRCRFSPIFCLCFSKGSKGIWILGRKGYLLEIVICFSTFCSSFLPPMAWTAQYCLLLLAVPVCLIELLPSAMETESLQLLPPSYVHCGVYFLDLRLCDKRRGLPPHAK